jgi:predicted nicotinamide N-methyase
VRRISDGAVDGLRTWATEIIIEGDRLYMKLRAPELAPVVVRYLVNCGVEVFEFTPRRLSLEDRFMQILGMDEGL